MDKLRLSVEGEFIFLGSGKVAQLIKCLTHKRQNLISDSKPQSQNLCGRQVFTFINEPFNSLRYEARLKRGQATIPGATQV